MQSTISNQAPNVAKNLSGCMYLNLPDFHFIRWCCQSFNINKGIFHTVEQSLYEKGLHSIIVRRLFVIAFLDFASNQIENRNNKTRIKFGKGGLSKALDDFFIKYDH